MEFVGGGEPGAGAEEGEGGPPPGGDLGREGLEVLPGAELVPAGPGPAGGNPEEVSLGSFEREEEAEAAEAAVAGARAALAALPALRAAPVPAGVVPGFGAFVWDAAGAVQVRPALGRRRVAPRDRPAPLEGGPPRRRREASARASDRAGSAPSDGRDEWRPSPRRGSAARPAPPPRALALLPRLPPSATDDDDDDRGDGDGGMNDGGGSCGGRGGWGTGRWGACRRSSSRTRRTACR